MNQEPMNNTLTHYFSEIHFNQSVYRFLDLPSNVFFEIFRLKFCVIILFSL